MLWGQVASPFGPATSSLVLQSRSDVSRLVAAAGSLGLLDLLQHLVEVVARRVLQRRVRDVALELLQPERLPDGQHVPVVDIGRGSRADRAALAHERLEL